MRYKGKSTLATTYDVKYYGPLDTRFLVPTYADLTNPANWTIDGYGSNAYNGMIVAVGSNESDPSKNGIYRLFDANNPGAKDEPDVTKEANWHKLAEVDETGRGVFNAETHYDFPSVGSVDVIYKAQSEKKLYQWNPAELKYEELETSDETSIANIELINGGNANGNS